MWRLRALSTFIFIHFLFGMAPVLAKSPIRVSEKLEISSEQIEALEAAFPKLPEDKILYHWTTPEVGERWYRQNGLPQDEVDFYNTPTGDRQVYGAGVYFADDTESSRYLNPKTTFLTIWRIQKGRPLYDDDIVKKIIGRALTNNEMTELGKIIPFIRKVTGQWYITHSSENLNNPISQEFLEFQKLEPRFDRIKSVIEVIAKTNSQAAGYLDSFFHLASYSDGLSLYRATQANPTNPWHEFEPENFERYRKVRGDYLQASRSGLLGQRARITDGHAGFGDRGGFMNWQFPEEFAEKQIDLLLKINGDLQGISPIIRDDSVRAGGTEAGNRFLATHAQAAALEQNPYLEVNVIPDPKGRGLLAEYYYPDVFHYKKLKGILPDALYQRLTETKPATLRSNSELRRSLNKEIISELLKHFFQSIHRKPVDFPNLLATLISIHPCQDFNGRAVRIYSEMAAAEMHRMSPHLFESDLDILTTRSALGHNLSGATAAYVNFVRSVVEETFNANSQRRMPIYFQPNIMDPLLQAFHLGEADHKLRLSEGDLELIRNRNITELYNKHIGLGWDITAETFDRAYQYANQTKTLPIFISAVQASLLRRVEINGDNLALWAKIRALKKHADSLLTPETRVAQDIIGLKVIQDMKDQVSALKVIVQSTAQSNFFDSNRNGNFFVIVNRWKELSKFFEGYPSDESSALQKEFKNLLMEHVHTIAKLLSDLDRDSNNFSITDRLAIIAHFFKGDSRYIEVVKEFADHLPLRAKTHVSYFLDYLAQEKPLSRSDQWSEGRNSSLRGVRIILVNYANHEEVAAPLAAALFSSPRTDLSDAKEEDQQTLKDFDALVPRLLQTSSRSAFVLVEYALARKFSEDTIIQILESNRHSEDPLRLFTNNNLAEAFARRSKKVAEWLFKNAPDSEEDPWSPKVPSESKKTDPYVVSLRDIALNRKGIRPQGLSVNAQMGLLENLISNNLEDNAHIKKANDLLLGLSKFNYRSSNLIKTLNKKNAIRSKVLAHLIRSLRAQLRSPSDAEEAAGILLSLTERRTLDDDEINLIRNQVEAVTNGAGIRSLAWLLAIERPDDPLSLTIVDRARDYDSDFLCRWLDGKSTVDGKRFEKLIAWTSRPGLFGYYVDKKIVSSVVKILKKNPDSSELWQIAFSQYIKGRFAEGYFGDFTKQTGLPSKVTRKTLLSRIVQEASDSTQDALAAIWYADLQPDPDEIAVMPPRLASRFGCSKAVAGIVAP